MIDQNIQTDLRSCISCNSSAKYKCPKCKLFTCSLNCYKKHNLSCLQLFQNQMFKKQLQGHKSPLQLQKQTAKMLIRTRQQYQNIEYVEDQQHNINRLQYLLNKDNLSVRDLNFRQQSIFFDYLQQLKIQQWIPFWHINQSINIYLQHNPQYKGIKYHSVFKFRQSVKKFIKVIPPFKLIGKNASPLFPFIYLRYLLSAIIVLRGCNGQLSEICWNWFTHLSKIYEIKPKSNESVQIVIKQLQKLTGKQWLLLCISDAITILKNRYKEVQIFFRLSQLVKRQDKIRNKLIYIMSYGRDVQKDNLLLKLRVIQNDNQKIKL